MRNKPRRTIKRYIEHEGDNKVLAVIFVIGGDEPFSERQVIEIPQDLEVNVGDEFDIQEDKVVIKKPEVKKTWFGFGR